MPVDANPWVDSTLAAMHLARIYDAGPEGGQVTPRRQAQWSGRLWTWMSRAKAVGEQVPTWERRGRRVYYRLAELEEFAARHIGAC